MRTVSIALAPAAPVLLSLLSLSLLSIACGPAERACVPGESVACTGAGGCSGGQMCNADGTGYGACDCGGAIDGGPGDGSVPDATIPDASSPDASSDAGLDAAATDAGPVVCDPGTHEPCAPDQRCAWVRLAIDRGEARCVPNGTVAEGDTCTWGSDGALGHDDCARGLVCINDACRPVCDVASPSCDGDAHCTAYAGFFRTGDEPATYGACTPSCDPLTQRRADGEPCPSGQGCYALFEPTGVTMVCARAGAVGVGEVVEGPAFANVCVPGATVMRRGDGQPVCAAFCRPLETHAGAPAGALGVSPYRCDELGAPGTECLFSWLLSADVPDPRLNALGICFDRSGRAIDLDGDGSTEPWPSCTTVMNTDSDGDGIRQHEELGCAPRG